MNAKIKHENLKKIIAATANLLDELQTPIAREMYYEHGIQFTATSFYEIVTNPENFNFDFVNEVLVDYINYGDAFDDLEYNQEQKLEQSKKLNDLVEQTKENLKTLPSYEKFEQEELEELHYKFLVNGATHPTLDEFVKVLNK